jgi:hypothetical protein
LRGGTNITCSQALKWVAHFLGDIAQPLHASGRAAGGNGIPVVFDGAATELHAVSRPASLSCSSPPQFVAGANTADVRYGTNTSCTSGQEREYSQTSPSILFSKTW